ncbi:glycosyltransferase family 4 protein [Fibrella aquatilis]|uniref:Glycosyltransferase family 4 protein n=1 Tax=Fibrella aquatilis TaxID=2817059 RepID=A0A939GB22_9BACT|nr:glycosyltransferase family 4 protein [Fibrella aquatilis]MBO0933093.1 glycosyltransferase family 4 protein [Fibrella aquatilis]
MANVYIVCPGLGRVNRGFESFAQECFTALSGEDSELTFFLFKGGGSAQAANNIHVCWNIPRSYTLKLVGMDLAYRLENFTFILSLLSKLFTGRPTVILISDSFGARYLMRLKKLFRLSYKVLFSNGGPSGPPYRFDYVHQLTHLHQHEAIRYGEPSAKHTVVPYGFNFNRSDHRLPTHEIEYLKIRLGIPTAKKIIISVGAINRLHKRMNYVIDEVAGLEDIYLIMLGQIDEQETAPIIALAKEKLGTNFTIKTVPQKEVALYYACADIFVLGSLREGFGRVYIEALHAGLPVCAHDHELTRELLSTHGHFADFTKEGALAGLLQQLLANPVSDSARQDYHTYAYNNFSWDVLKPAYLAMMRSTLQNEYDCAIPAGRA